MKGILAAAVAALMVAAPGYAQDYPNKPVRIIVPTAPGGMADIVGRTFGQKLTEKTKQPAVVDNRTGAGGILAAELVAMAPPDGYTLYIGFHATNSILPTLDRPPRPRRPSSPGSTGRRRRRSTPPTCASGSSRAA